MVFFFTFEKEKHWLNPFDRNLIKTDSNFRLFLDFMSFFPLKLFSHLLIPQTDIFELKKVDFKNTKVDENREECFKIVFPEATKLMCFFFFC